MKKIFFICMLLFLVTGCSANYNLEIDKNFKFKENVELITSKENFEISYDTINDGVEEIFNNISKDLNSSLYEFDLKKYFRKNVEVVFNNKYDDKSELETSPFLSNVNGKVIEYDTEKGTKIFQITIDYDFFELLKTKKYTSIPIEHANINIKFPYKILSSNADKVNDNILTWDLKTLIKRRSFYVEYDENNLYESKKSFIIPIVVASILGGVIIVLIAKKKEKDKF